MSSAAPPVALVTGGNKGIGYQIVKTLCEYLGDKGIVYLAARDEKRGQEAVSKLKEAGLHPKFLQLDISDPESVENARDYIKKQHGGLNILVNNAGVAFNNGTTKPFSEQAELTLATNFTGTLSVCEALLPLLRPHSRVVIVASRQGNVRKIAKPALKERLISKDLTLEELRQIMQDFVSAAQEGTHEEAGFPNSAYRVSKIGLVAASRILMRDIAKYNKNDDVIVNACCPGHVNTEMSDHKGKKTVEEGADTPLYLALLPPSDDGTKESLPKGEFVAERKLLDWTQGYEGH